MIELNKKTQQEFELKFSEPWINSPFENEPYQLQILGDLGETLEYISNDEGVEELALVHKYKVKEV